MRYEVELTRGAEADLDRLVAALAGRWPEGADRLTARFAEAVSRPESFPFGCGLAHENGRFPGEVRHLLFAVRKGRPYRALFTVQGNRVRVLAIRAPGERPVNPDETDG